MRWRDGFLVDSSDIAAKLSCSYKKWVGGCGLLGCKNQATADYPSQVVASIELNGQSFCGWPKGEHGKLKRMTFYTPNLTHLPAGHSFVNCLIRQNELPGGYVFVPFCKVRGMRKQTA